MSLKYMAENPLLSKKQKNSVAVSMESISVPTVFANKATRKREIGKYIRKESAAEAIKGFNRKTDVYGFSKGQFSLVELIEATLDKTGPCHLTLSTWTAASSDLSGCHRFITSGRILSARFLLDFTFQRRQPAIAKLIRDVFGHESLRVTRNHSKFFTLRNEKWTVVCHTSQNLNMNPRFENFFLMNDPELFNFLKNIMDDLFKSTTSKKQVDATTNALQHQFMEF